jgi:hypothetical protein
MQCSSLKTLTATSALNIEGVYHFYTVNQSIPATVQYKESEIHWK